MRLAKDDSAALAATIEAIGFTGSLTNVECLAFSPASAESNRAVHAKTNEHLLAALMRNSPGQCIHITGEMRALADPFHRRLCAELARRANTRFTIVYNIPPEHSRSPEGVGKWNSQSWRSKGWAEKLSAMHLVGEALVDVRAFDTLHDIQYSVFGNRYVLLQERHDDEGRSQTSPAKRIWLLDSEALNGHLTERALQIIDKSRDVPEALFKRFFAKITGVTARNILARLAGNGSLHLDTLIDKDLIAFDPTASDAMENLTAIGFVESRQDSVVTITDEGKQFIETLR